jgi:hypothetical protein
VAGVAFDRGEPDREEAAKLLESVLRCPDESSYLAVFENTTEGALDNLEALIRDMPAEADFRVVLGYVGNLLLDSRTDPRRAWQTYLRDLEGLDRCAALLSPKIEAIELALTDGRFQEVLALSDAARPEYTAAGLTPQISRMHLFRGLAYAQMRSGNMRDNASMAIREIRAAARALTDKPGQQARDLMSLGLAFGWRASGDRRRISNTP